MATGSMAWAMEEFGSVSLGDARRRARLLELAAGFADKPCGTVTGAFPSTAERRGVYRFLDNADVAVEEVERSAFAATVARCAGFDVVIVPVDGTSLNLTDEAHARGTGPVGARKSGARGFQVMTAIGVAPDGTPLGLLAQSRWARSEEKAARSSRKRAVEEKETRYWIEVQEAVRGKLKGTGTRPWFQYDRGGDAWSILLAAHEPDIYLTVRAAHDRRILGEDDERGHLWATLRGVAAAGTCTVEIPGRSGRKARTANLAIRYQPVRLDPNEVRNKTRHPIAIFAVLATEEGTTPEGETPLEWMLLTSRPTATFDDAATVVLGYTYRWKIEEFHKAWKSGACNVEDTQLQSTHGIHLLAVVLGTVAMRLLRMTWVARRKPDLPATVEYSPAEIAAVYALKNITPLKRRPASVGQLTLWIAELGGYTGKSSGGPPGIITLGRGLAYILPVARLFERTQKHHVGAGGIEM